MKKTFLTYLIVSLSLFLSLISCTHDNDGRHNVIRDAVKDVDGNHYDAVRLGKQVWMQSNLRTTHFRDGSEIPQGTSDDYSCTQSYYYQPTTQQIPTYEEKTYGFHYNWPAVNDAHGLCPKGWHVPTDAEWTEMEEYAGSKSEYVYGDNPLYIAKALASTAGWFESNEHGTPGCEPEKNNATGFAAVPAGPYYGFNGEYYDYGYNASFWSSTAFGSDYAYYHSIYHHQAVMNRDYRTKGSRCSVRCVRD